MVSEKACQRQLCKAQGSKPSWKRQGVIATRCIGFDSKSLTGSSTIVRSTCSVRKWGPVHLPKALCFEFLKE